LGLRMSKARQATETFGIIYMIFILHRTIDTRIRDI
jgi:hypothetical protein